MSMIVILHSGYLFRYHKAHLTRRLILDCSTDNDLEENMVEWLRVCPLVPVDVGFSQRSLGVELVHGCHSVWNALARCD